jgi:hypothetical protein
MEKYYIKKEKMCGEMYYMIYVKWFGFFGSFYERWNTHEAATIRLNELNGISTNTHDESKEPSSILNDIISRLQKLKKWDCSTGSIEFIDWEEDEKYGDWIRREDVEELIKEFQNKLDSLTVAK